MKTNVQLRAHHLYAFSLYSNENSGLLGFVKNLPLMKQFYDLGEAFTNIGTYGFKHYYGEQKIFRKIMKNKVNVKITDTLDDICSTCGLKEKLKCDEGNGEGDRLYANACGLEIGKMYSSKEIVDLMKNKEKK